MSKPQESVYENNPFMVGLTGLRLFFQRAQSIAIITIVLMVLSLGSQIGQSVVDSLNERTESSSEVYSNWQAWVTSLSTSDLIVFTLLIATALFLIFTVIFILSAMFDYTSSQLAKDKPVNLREAFQAASSHIGSYIWLQVLIGIKILLWSLLLIIPGIIMAVRYSLAGVSFFDAGTRGNDAIKHSLRLTKGAWLTTFASGALWNLITLGFIEAVLRPGTNAILYRQFKPYEATNEPKPDAHVLSWLTLIVPIVLFVVLISGLVLIGLALSINGFS